VISWSNQAIARASDSVSKTWRQNGA